MRRSTTRRPPSLRLGGRAYRFNYRPAEEMPDCDGEFRSETAAIDIKEGQSSINEADTVLHEVFHAILFCQGRDYGGKTEELYVRALATGLTAALSDNPEFAKWLLQRSTQ